MVNDIASAIYVKLTQNGIVFSPGTFRSIRSTYYRIGLDFVEQYYSLSKFNGFTYDRNEEEETVGLFSRIIYKAGIDMLDNWDHTVFIPNWKRVNNAKREFLEDFYEAVELDNQ